MKNKLILGTVQMGLDYGINNTNGQVTLKDSFNILDTAFEQGVRILDTAEAYGNAHKVIGEFHSKNLNKVFKVITKLPHHIDDKIEVKVRLYIKQLNVTKLEALLFHNFETYVGNKDGLIILTELKKRGLVNKIGVSVYTNEQMAVVINDPLVDVIQLPFNILDNVNLRGEVIKRAKAAGKEIHTRSSFLQGLIFQDPFFQNKVAQALNKELIEINRISTQSKCSIQQLALNYCIEQKEIDQVLIGVDSVNQLNQNIDICDRGISNEVTQELNKIYVSDINLLNPSLWNNL